MLLGSTEWAEAHADELRQKAVVYINSDGNGRGFLSMGGSHTLEHFINDVARDIDDPEAKMSVWKRRQLQRIATAKAAEARTEIRERGDLRIDALGSGTDYTAFLDHLGVASLDLGFGGADDGGDLSLDLRRLLLVYPLRRHRLRLRRGAGADGRHDGDAAGRRRRAAVRLPGHGRHGADVREGAAELLTDRQDAIGRAQPPDRGGRVPGDPRPATADRGADARKRCRRTSTSRRSRTRLDGADRAAPARYDGAVDAWPGADSRADAARRRAHRPPARSTASAS